MVRTFYILVFIASVVTVIGCDDRSEPKVKNSEFEKTLSLGEYRDSLLSLYGQESFWGYLNSLKEKISNSSVNPDFWTYELMLLVDTFNNELTFAEKEVHYENLENSIDTLRFEELGFLYMWLDWLDKNEDRIGITIYLLNRQGKDKMRLEIFQKFMNMQL